MLAPSGIIPAHVIPVVLATFDKSQDACVLNLSCQNDDIATYKYISELQLIFIAPATPCACNVRPSAGSETLALRIIRLGQL